MTLQVVDFEALIASISAILCGSYHSDSGVLDQQSQKHEPAIGAISIEHKPAS